MVPLTAIILEVISLLFACAAIVFDLNNNLKWEVRTLLIAYALTTLVLIIATKKKRSLK
jgi:hypothetical protein